MVVVAALLSALGAVAIHKTWGAVAPDAISKPRNPLLFVPEERLDFGQAWETREFHWTLPITNQCERDVEIESFATTCNCTKVVPSSLSIPKGETRDILLSIDLTFEPGTDDVRAHSFDLALGPKQRGEPTPSKRDWWVVRGTVKRMLRLDRPFVQFGRCSELEQPLPSQLVRVTSAVPLQRLTATSSLPDLRLAVATNPERNREQFELEVSTPSRLPLGKMQGVLTLVAHLESGARVEKTLSAIGEIVADIRADPPAARFGARTIGETGEETVSVYSLVNKPFGILEIRAVGEGLTVTQDSQPDRPTAIRLKQQFLTRGEQGSEIRVLVRDASGERKEVVIPVSYLGLDR
jgi:hypothetical protein